MQRRRVLIVDGYNVIRNNERYRRLGNDYEGGSGWNMAREGLINDAATLAQLDYEECVVVFDAAGNPDSSGQPYREAGIEIVFSPSGVSADSVIERYALKARRRGFEVVVVSSDFAIQSTVFGGGVTRMSATDFCRAAESVVDEQHDGQAHTPHPKATVAERIGPDAAIKLAALRDSL